MKRGILFTPLSCIWFFALLGAQESQAPENENPVKFVTEIYDLVSADSGEQVDWEKLRSFFIEEAVIVLRTSREATTQFTVNGFIQDFIDFYASPAVVDHGFREKVVKSESQEYKDMAFVWIVYEASFPNSGRPSQQGLDFWLLERLEGQWKIVSVTNEVILPGESIPRDLKKHSGSVF